MSKSRVADIIGVLKGAQTVANAIVKHQDEILTKTLKNSSVKFAAEECVKNVSKRVSNINPSKVPEQISTEIKDVIDRISIVEKGVSQYLKVQSANATGVNTDSTKQNRSTAQLYIYDLAKDAKEILLEKDIKSSSQIEIETQSQHFEKREHEQSIPVKKYSTVKEKIDTITTFKKGIPTIQLSDKEKEILQKLELEHEKKIKREEAQQYLKTIADENIEVKKEPVIESTIIPPTVRPKQTLSATARERKVPSTRLQRMVSFGTLGLGLGVGTVAEYTRRTFGLKSEGVSQTVDRMFLTKANAERIVSTLCKVRGAALKIGQILSIQDNSVISPELQKAFERVRQSADFMPTWQVEKVLIRELGADWRSKVASFEEKPFAAASIGQVHLATLHNGRNVAMKIQYPGVAEGIQSDIANLVGILKIWNIFPDGMFIDNLVEVANRELAWEVDYIREAECSKKYKELVSPYKDYYVPEVIDELSSKQVFTTEFIDGVPVDKCADMDLETREHICKLIMQLCLRELFVFRYMQTDPNWSNFFYNPQSRKLILLDFGACRSYSKEFMDKYIEVINAASEGNRNVVLKISRDMGFLTGYESKIMEEAHVDAVMTLGQVFDRDHQYYDFGGQDVTQKMQMLVPTIINHRLCPPPEEIYSLHRKLSGVFLLCAKLRVRINCRDMFRQVYQNYKFGTA